MIAILKAKDADSVAKCNATLIIGELNEQEMNPVKPYAQAFNALMIVLKTPKFFKDEVRVAALVGVERFAAYGAIPADKKAAVTALLMEQLKQATPPPGRTVAGHNWLRRNAAQILAALGSPGPDNGVVTAIESIVADPQVRMTPRCEMAQYLGQLKYPTGAKIDYEGLAGLIGHQTVDICSREVESVTSNSQFLSATEDARLHRFLTYVVHCSLQALEGPDAKSGLLAGAAQDPNRDFVDSVRGKLKGLYTSLEGAETTDLVDVRNRLSELQGILPPKPAAKSEVAPSAQPDKATDPKSADPKKVGAEQAAVEPPKADK